jgi:hypothetical protein
MAETGTRQQAQRFVAELRGRTDAYCDGRLSEDEFSRQQRATWDAIHRAPAVDEEVLHLIRQSLPVVPEGR